jgi:hypothetical protein
VCAAGFDGITCDEGCNAGFFQNAPNHCEACIHGSIAEAAFTGSTTACTCNNGYEGA